MSRLHLQNRSSRRLGSVALLAIGIAALAAEAWAGVPGPFPRTRAALNSATDAYATAFVPTHAFLLEGIASDFVYDAPATFTEYSNGIARLTGRIHSVSNPGLQFLVDATLSTRIVFGDWNYHPAGSPYKELKPSAYKTAGGPVDVNNFYYYDKFNGTLTGFGLLDGAKVSVTRMGPCFQAGLGSNGMNIHDGMSGWLTGHTVHQPTNGPALPGSFNGDMNNDFCDDTFNASAAEADFLGQYIAGFALYLPGIDNCRFGPDAIFHELPDGTATLTGTAISLVDPQAKFLVNIGFSGRVNPGDINYPPLGSPKKELLPSAYVENGGPIDSNTWHYYSAFSGSLSGQDHFAGGFITVSRFGPSFQVGVGANGKNGNLGASGWMNLNVQSQPNTAYQWSNPGAMGDINIDLGCDENLCARSADTDNYGQYVSGFALYMPGIDNCSMDPGSQFVEHADGTAKFTGIATSLTDPNAHFSVDIDFSQRVNPGDVNYPPLGSPKLELQNSAYTQNGGIIDPDTWHYYKAFTGTLLGLGDFNGAKITVSRIGPSFQVGIGANGKNANPGGSGWMTLNIVSQPTTAYQWPNAANQGDMNLDLESDCAQNSHVNTMTAARYGSGCPGYGPLVPSLDVLGTLQPGTVATLSLSNSNPGALAFLLLGLNQGHQFIGYGGCYLLVSPLLAVGGPYLTNAQGHVDLVSQLPLAFVPGAVRLQYALDPMKPPFAVSNGVEILVQ